MSESQIESIVLEKFNDMNINIIDHYFQNERQKQYFVVKAEYERVHNMPDVVNTELKYGIKSRYGLNYTMHEMTNHYRFEFSEA